MNKNGDIRTDIFKTIYCLIETDEPVNELI